MREIAPPAKFKQEQADDWKSKPYTLENSLQVPFSNGTRIGNNVPAGATTTSGFGEVPKASHLGEADHQPTSYVLNSSSNPVKSKGMPQEHLKVSEELLLSASKKS